MRLQLALILFFVFSGVLAQSIVDYSHTDSYERTLFDEKRSYDIDIVPYEQNDSYLQFPAACQLNRQLIESEAAESTRLQQVDVEQYLANLKGNMNQILRLSDKIKKSKQYLTEFPLGQSNVEESPIDEQKMEELRQIENKLRTINASIEEKVIYLRELINEEIKRTKHKSFDEIQLKFELNAYEARLKYLTNLKETKREPNKGISQKKIDEFFKNVDYDLVVEQQELSNLNELLTNFAGNSELKLRISNLEQQIEAATISIHQKQHCLNQREKLINEQNKEYINAIVRNLKELKKGESKNRRYCEGVATKLLLQLKKVFKIYNYSYSCSEGLNDLQTKRTILVVMLKKLQDDLANLHYDNRSKVIQEYFNYSQNYKLERIKEIKNFTFDGYQIDESVIIGQILFTKEKISNIQYRLEHPPEGEQKPIDYQKIREKIEEINQEQYEYCRMKELYEDRYRKMQILVKKYEVQAKQRGQKVANYILKVNELRELQAKFNELRSSLLQALS